MFLQIFLIQLPYFVQNMENFDREVIVYKGRLVGSVVELNKKKHLQDKRDTRNDTKPATGYGRLPKKYFYKGKYYKCKYVATGSCIEKNSFGEIDKDNTCPLYFSCTRPCNRWDRNTACKNCPCKEAYQFYEKESERLYSLIKRRIHLKEVISYEKNKYKRKKYSNSLKKIQNELKSSPHYNI